jgi:hypothetical protein
MMMPWFIPFGLGIGLTGTRTALQARHQLQASRQEGSWWLLAVLSWLPFLCWFLAQFVVQDY